MWTTPVSVGHPCQRTAVSRRRKWKRSQTICTKATPLHCTTHIACTTSAACLCHQTTKPSPPVHDSATAPRIPLDHPPHCHTATPSAPLHHFFLNKFIHLFIYLFLAALGLRCCARAFSSCSERGLLFIAVRGPLTVAASLVAEHKLQTRGLQ